MKSKIASILNIIIAVFVIVGLTLMLLGVQVMGPEDGFSDNKISMFRFYTVDSNVLMGIVSIITTVYEVKLIIGKIEKIPNKLYILKLASTVGVALTFIIVVLYLAPIATYGYFSMFRNANLFFHFLVPVLSISVFCFFEKTEEIKFKHTFTGMATMLIYSLFYLTNVLVHTENGKVSTEYDWYWFVQNGIWTAVIVVPIIFLITYGISYALWKTNKMMKKV